MIRLINLVGGWNELMEQKIRNLGSDVRGIHVFNGSNDLHKGSMIVPAKTGQKLTSLMSEPMRRWAIAGMIMQ